MGVFFSFLFFKYSVLCIISVYYELLSWSCYLSLFMLVAFFKYVMVLVDVLVFKS